MSDQPLAKVLTAVAALTLIPHTPGDDHSEPAAKKVTAELLRALADAGDSFNAELRLHMHQRRALRAIADAVEAGAYESGGAS